MGETVKDSSFTDWLIAAFTLVLMIVAIHQGNIMSSQLKDTETQFTISHRPWVNVSGLMEVKGPLVFDNEGASVTVSYTLKNAGSSPSLGTVIADGSGLMIGNMPQTAEEARQVIGCDKGVGIPREISDSGGIPILPGDTAHSNLTLKTTKTVSSTMPQEVWFPLCVKYKDELGGFHGTGLLWRFVASDGNLLITPIGSIQGTFQQVGIGNEAY